MCYRFLLILIVFCFAQPSFAFYEPSNLAFIRRDRGFFQGILDTANPTKRLENLECMRDWYMSPYDEEAKERTAKRFGEAPDPLDRDGAAYFAGKQIARLYGVQKEPSAYWLRRGKSVPEGINDRGDMFDAIGQEGMDWAKAENDRRLEVKRKIKAEQDMFVKRAPMGPSSKSRGKANDDAIVFSILLAFFCLFAILFFLLALQRQRKKGGVGPWLFFSRGGLLAAVFVARDALGIYGFHPGLLFVLPAGAAAIFAPGLIARALNLASARHASRNYKRPIGVIVIMLSGVAGFYAFGSCRYGQGIAYGLTAGALAYPVFFFISDALCKAARFYKDDRADRAVPYVMLSVVVVSACCALLWGVYELLDNCRW